MNGIAQWVRRWGPVLVWMGFIFWMSSRSDARVSTLWPELSRWLGAWLGGPERANFLSAKAGHVAEYFILARLLASALAPGRAGTAITGLAAWALAVAYAVTDEVHQAFVPGRTAAAWDLVIDAVGAFLAVAPRLRLAHPARLPQHEQRPQ